MALENTTLVNEINEITRKGPKPVHYAWRAQIHANNDTVDPLKLLSIDIVRDYTNAYSDYILAEVAIGAGTYQHDVLPYKNDLTVTLIREPIGEVADTGDLTKDIESQELGATLLDASSEVLEGNSPFIQDKLAGDLSDIVYVKLQLVDLALQQVRMQSMGTLFRNTTIGDALKYLLTEVSRQVDVDDEHAILGVDMVEPDNTENQSHLVVPHGTRFTDMPDLLNVKGAGLYSTGFGFYLQQHIWYVYSLYDLTRFDKADKTLTLINIPKNRMPQVERTYRRTKHQLIVLVTGETKHKDQSEEDQLNLGNGVRFLDAQKVMDGFVEVKDNVARALRVKNMTEYVTNQRKNKLNNVQLSAMAITTNSFVEAGKLAAREGGFIQVVWQNSDPGAIFPGMPVKYLYTIDDKPCEVTGVVHKAHHYVQMARPGLTTSRHVTNTALLLFIDRRIGDQDPAEGS